MNLEASKKQVDGVWCPPSHRNNEKATQPVRTHRSAFAVPYLWVTRAAPDMRAPESLAGWWGLSTIAEKVVWFNNSPRLRTDRRPVARLACAVFLFLPASLWSSLSRTPSPTLSFGFSCPPVGANHMTTLRHAVCPPSLGWLYTQADSRGDANHAKNVLVVSLPSVFAYEPAVAALLAIGFFCQCSVELLRSDTTLWAGPSCDVYGGVLVSQLAGWMT